MHALTVFIVLVVFVSIYRGEITVKIDPPEVCEGASVTLTCFGSRVIAWRRHNALFSVCITTCDQQLGYNITFDANTGIGIMHINRTSLVRDKGYWQCVAVDYIDTGNSTLKIKAPASSTIKDKGRLLFIDGMVTEVICATGTIDSDVSFTWYIDSTDNILPEQTTGFIDGSPASFLQLTSTKQLNNKTLYCSATNQCGTGNADNITLVIR